MNIRVSTGIGLPFLFSMAALCASGPQIQSLSPAGTLVWTNPVQGNLSILEQSTNLIDDVWTPFYYDWGTDGVRTTALPSRPARQSFYRVGVQTNIPESSLIMHLTFDNDLSTGAVLDASGHENHGVRFSTTNWPSASLGPDGNQSGKFTKYDSISGDYVAVPYAPNLDRLSNGTILVWGYYTANSYGASALLDAAWDEPGSWVMGRNYAYDTKFSVVGNNGTTHVVTYPDRATDYDTGGWHHYGVTWDGQDFTGYFDGLPISTNSQAGVPELTIGGRFRWIAVGCRHHDGSPEWGDDAFPNNGWMGGWIDDVRIYNRALTTAQVVAIYGSFDEIPPSTPRNLTARAVSSSQIEVRWDPATDNFRVESYRARRNGMLVGQIRGSLFADGGLIADTEYEYTIQACDVGGNISEESVPVFVTTRAPNAGVEAILDEADGEPWIAQFGSWSSRANSGAFAGFFVQDDNTEKGTKSVVYRPLLPESGTYAIEIWYPQRANAGTNIPVDIIFGVVTNTVVVNQRKNGSRWNALGNYNLPAGTNAAVRIRNDDASGYVEADAVRFIR